MSRLRATMANDVRSQWRNGFYLASGFVVITTIILMRLLPRETAAYLLPVIVLENVLVNTYYFVAGLILLEKGEGTLEAQVTTPLRGGEYLASKVLTLTALSLVESVLISTLGYGAGVGVIWFALGVVLAAAIFCLFGIVLAARYDSINEYLLPSVVYTTILSLPMLGYFGVGAPEWYAAHPIAGPLWLLEAAYEPIGAWRAVFSVLYPALWIAPLALWSRRSMRRFIVAAAGAR